MATSKGPNQAMHRALKKTYELTKVKKTEHETGILTVTSNDFRNLFSTFEDEVWYRILLTLLQHSDPPVVSETCFDGLKAESDKVVVANQGGKASDRLLESVQDYLHRLTWPSFIALGEVCALIRDTADDLNEVTKVLGPRILVREESYTGQASPADLLRFLCDHCDYYFGIGKISNNALGYRDGKLCDADENSDPFAPQKNSLRDFFSIVSPIHSKIVDELFELYDFATLARALYDEYDALPEGWKSPLADDPKTRTWFDNTIPSINEVPEDELIIPHINKPFRPPLQRDVMNLIVDEIVDSEFTYFEQMKTFNDCFVEIVKKEAFRLRGDSKGPKKSLGLSELEIQCIFGERLGRVIGLVEDMAVDLEVLRLVRDPIDRPGGGGRPAVLADIFIRNEKNFQATYGSYNAEMKSTTAMVKKAIESTPVNKNFSPDTVESMKGLNFDEMWEVVSKKYDCLRSKTIDSILIQPVKRLPNYILLFGRLKKEAGKAGMKPSDPILQKLDKVTSICRRVTGKVDQIIVSSSKRDQILGRNQG
eukprot:CAMPEP_0184026742 /NCGR_PEP_ID=MMETSP0954-20121128/13727_1 /TAXON_ID=627963 /ORGANISM="Aplanochytrium sp, Strain PBS07" /LENGTH=537 /DNA_ID=CAMNT_0026311055 /DNA_START=366 /DNA_END=1979 /DNA_ORIENTATION=+